METYYACAIANGITYNATVTDFGNGRGGEAIYKESPMGQTCLSDEDFSIKLLGSASKSEYAKCILASAIYKDAHVTPNNIQWRA